MKACVNSAQFRSTLPLLLISLMLAALVVIFANRVDALGFPGLISLCRVTSTSRAKAPIARQPPNTAICLPIVLKLTSRLINFRHIISKKSFYKLSDVGDRSGSRFVSHIDVDMLGLLASDI
jgi:hypothetical protein